MGDMNEYTEDTLRATVQAAELAIRDSEERGRLLAEMWQGLGLAADAGELLFQAPERAGASRRRGAAGRTAAHAQFPADAGRAGYPAAASDADAWLVDLRNHDGSQKP